MDGCCDWKQFNNDNLLLITMSLEMFIFFFDSKANDDDFFFSLDDTVTHDSELETALLSAVNQYQYQTILPVLRGAGKIPQHW